MLKYGSHTMVKCRLQALLEFKSNLSTVRSGRFYHRRKYQQKALRLSSVRLTVGRTILTSTYLSLRLKNDSRPHTSVTRS